MPLAQYILRPRYGEKTASRRRLRAAWPVRLLPQRKPPRGAVANRGRRHHPAMDAGRHPAACGPGAAARVGGQRRRRGVAAIHRCRHRFCFRLLGRRQAAVHRDASRRRPGAGVQDPAARFGHQRAQRPAALPRRAAAPDGGVRLAVAPRDGPGRGTRPGGGHPHRARHDRGAAADTPLPRAAVAWRAVRADELRHGRGGRHGDGHLRQRAGPRAARRAGHHPDRQRDQHPGSALGGGPHGAVRTRPGRPGTAQLRTAGQRAGRDHPGHSGRRWPAGRDRQHAAGHRGFGHSCQPRCRIAAPYRKRRPPCRAGSPCRSAR